MEDNELCGLSGDHPVRGTYTTEGITKLCEALKGSAVTSLKCAAPECSLLCQRPLTSLLSHYIHSAHRSHSLRSNGLTDEAKQALKDAAGSSVRIKF